MPATAPDAIPDTWDDERDCAFFSIVARLFTTQFVYGAGVLLASYDDDAPPATPAAVPGNHPQSHHPVEELLS